MAPWTKAVQGPSKISSPQRHGDIVARRKGARIIGEKVAQSDVGRNTSKTEYGSIRVEDFLETPSPNESVREDRQPEEAAKSGKWRQ
jgi:hypothetical protein